MYKMNEIQSLENVKNLMQPFLEKGFVVEYLQQKGGDSSCVYIYRFKRGKNFFDWRETSGTNELHLIVCVDGAYQFPNIEKKYAKESRAFKLKHIFKKPTFIERRAFFAKLLCRCLQENETEFFGMAL